MGDEETQQSLWNFDGAELFLIFNLKEKVSIALELWDLETAYRKLRLLRMELDAKLKRKNKKIIEEFDEEVEKQKKVKRKEKKLTEKEEVDTLMLDLDNFFSKFSQDTEDEELREELYKKLENFYMLLCYIMKKHGLYFREGEDMRLAVLRR